VTSTQPWNKTLSVSTFLVVKTCKSMCKPIIDGWVCLELALNGEVGACHVPPMSGGTPWCDARNTCKGAGRLSPVHTIAVCLGPTR
jgi:hypothetical protein